MRSREELLRAMPVPEQPSRRVWSAAAAKESHRKLPSRQVRAAIRATKAKKQMLEQSSANEFSNANKQEQKVNTTELYKAWLDQDPLLNVTTAEIGGLAVSRPENDKARTAESSSREARYYGSYSGYPYYDHAGALSGGLAGAFRE